MEINRLFRIGASSASTHDPQVAAQALKKRALSEQPASKVIPLIPTMIRSFVLRYRAGMRSATTSP